jgi:hypothetical protein
VQADGGLVENKEGVDQRGAERRREIDPLGLAAREGAGLPVQAEIPEPHLDEIPQTCPDLPQQERRRLIHRGWELQALEERPRPLDREAYDIVDAKACEPGELLVGALHACRLEAPVGRQDSIAILPVPLPLQHPAPLGRSQIAPGDAAGYPAPPGKPQEILLTFPVGLGLPGPDRSRGERPGLVRHHQPVIHADDPAEPPARWARPDRGVEGEQVRHRIVIGDVAVGAVQASGEPPRAPDRTVHVQRVDQHAAGAVRERGLQALHDPSAVLRDEAQAVLGHLQRPALLAVDAGVALALQERLQLGGAERLGGLDREDDQGGGRSLGPREKFLGDALRRVPPDLAAAALAAESGGPGEEELQVIVKFRHRPHGGARGPDGVGLVDGNGGRDALDAVGPELVHPLEELAGVGREGLDVAPLPLEVVLPGPLDQDEVVRHRNPGKKDGENA